MSHEPTFDPEVFRRHLQTSWLGRPIIYLPSVPSTNDWASDFPARDLNHGTLVVTDHQTQGKGQHQRRWEGEKGKNLAVSLILHPERASGIHLLTMLVAKCSIEVLQYYVKAEPAIKWPNDILLSHAKIGGILTETSFTGARLESVIIGTGLNINQKQFPYSFDQQPTSLALLNGNRELSREKLLAEWSLVLERQIKRWEEGDLNQPKEINDLLLGQGEWVTISRDGQEEAQKYKVIGIDENGNLCLLNGDFEIITFTYEQIRINRD